MSTVHLWPRRVVESQLARPLILIVVLLTGDRSVMGDAVNSRAVAFLGWLTFIVMTAAAFGLLFVS